MAFGSSVFENLVYEIVISEENEPVRLIRRFVPMELLIALALSVVHTGFSSQPQRVPAQAKAVSASGDRTDINTATIDQLLKVPGMTRTWADRIVRFRPYRAKNELLDRGIVSSAVYDRIKDNIVAHHPAQ